MPAVDRNLEHLGRSDERQRLGGGSGGVGRHDGPDGTLADAHLPAFGAGRDATDVTAGQVGDQVPEPVHIKHLALEAAVVAADRHGQIEHRDAIRRPAHLVQGESRGQPGRDRGHDVTSVKRGRQRLGEKLPTLHDVQGLDRPVAMHEADHAVVRCDDHPAVVPRGQDPAIGSHRRIDDDHVNRLGRKVGPYLTDHKGGMHHIVRRHVVGHVNDRRLRGDRQDHALHAGDVMIRTSEVGRKGNDGPRLATGHRQSSLVSGLLLTWPGPCQTPAIPGTHDRCCAPFGMARFGCPILRGGIA